MAFFRGPSSRSIMKTGGAAAGALMALVVTWEGVSYVAYPDVVGVWTICNGETKGVRKGQRATKAECDSMLVKSLTEHEAGLLKCATRPMPESVQIAMVSLTYNIGVGAACKSTAVKMINAGRWLEACNAMSRFNRAGGSIIKGLVNRRRDEHRLCVRDL